MQCQWKLYKSWGANINSRPLKDKFNSVVRWWGFGWGGCPFLTSKYWPPWPHPIPTVLNIMPKDDFWGRQSASMQKKDILNKYSAWRHASFLLLPILFTKKPNIFWNRLLVPKSFFQASVSCFIEKFVFGFFVKPRPYDSQNTNSQSFWTLILLLVVCSFQS